MLDMGFVEHWNSLSEAGKDTPRSCEVLGTGSHSSMDGTKLGEVNCNWGGGFSDNPLNRDMMVFTIQFRVAEWHDRLRRTFFTVGTMFCL
ncbi:unnamed protein product [Schistosoma margrebowiei]|uniref:Uncharacterized protein n=1 Tax=Schistosoma margrebowiei TaxID=48269 RepID=A0A3P7XGC6_9TREM|nr:unnamed protein product [Schistosoma margrebowiei]